MCGDPARVAESQHCVPGPEVESDRRDEARYGNSPAETRRKRQGRGPQGRGTGAQRHALTTGLSQARVGGLTSPPPAQREIGRSALRRTKDRDRLALVAPVHLKVGPVDRNYGMLREQLAHPDEAQIGEVGLSVRITVR